VSGDPKLVPLARPLAVLSDAELEAERIRRKQARESRGVAPLPEPPPEGRVARALDALQKERELAQHYANLELKSGATLDEVERKYRELVQKYHPDKHQKDSDKHRAATELVAQLTKSYETLRAKLG
jgi:DnaJ-domain-containing protein 1